MAYCFAHPEAWNQMVHEESLCSGDRMMFGQQQGLIAPEDIRDNLILERMADGVIVLNADTDICYFNKGAERLTGFGAQQVLNGKQKPAVLWESSLLTSLVRSLIGCEEYDNVELNWMNPSKQSVVVLLSTSLIKREQQVVGVVGSYRDITSQKMRQQRLHLEDKLSAVNELAQGTAHEIRNAICAARGYIQLLQQQITGDTKHKNFVDIALKEMNHVNEVVMKLLLTTRPGAPEKSLVPPVTLVQEAVNTFREQLSNCNIKVQCRTKGKYAQMYGDRRQLGQVIQNITENALQAMPGGGCLTFVIRYCWEQKAVKLSVRDTGCGIAPECLTKTTGPFYTTKSKALGLGLTVCENIVMNHGGKLKIDSREGRWTKVTVWLPMA